MSKWINIAFIFSSLCLPIVVGNDSQLLKGLFVILNWTIAMVCAVNIYNEENKLNQRIEKLENKGE